jgi:hypothetical protein
LPRLYEQVVFNLVIIVLVLVLEIRILWVPRDEGEYDDENEDDLNTLLRETAVAGPTLFLR